MLRHLGPVFPVSGLRHQTSWPGSNKRTIWITLDSNETKLKILTLSSLSRKRVWHQLFGILLHKGLPQDGLRAVFLAENNKALLTDAVPVKLNTA